MIRLIRERQLTAGVERLTSSWCPSKVEMLPRLGRAFLARTCKRESELQAMRPCSNARCLGQRHSGSPVRCPSHSTNNTITGNGVASRYIETFLVGTWDEHERQHGRLTRHDEALLAELDGLLLPGTHRTVRH